MKLFYASSITFPSLPVNRLQTLQTARALSDKLGDQFILGAGAVDPQNTIYKGKLQNFGHHKSIVLAWRQLLYLRKEQVTVVFGREPALMWAIMVWNRLLFRLPIRFVYEAHDVVKGFRISYVLKRVVHVFCVSEGIAHDLRKVFPGVEASVLRNGVNLDLKIKESKVALRTKFNLPTDAHIVSYVGSIGRFSWKGEDVLLNAREYTKNEPVHYVIAGLKDDEVDSFMEQYGSPVTTMLGRLDEQEVTELQVLSDTVVLPNKQLDVMSERYTSPIKMFEYMRSGTPILASNTPSIREVLDETTALFFTSGDPEALAAGILTIMKNSTDASERAAAAKQEVLQYSWGNKAATIINTLL